MEEHMDGISLSHYWSIVDTGRGIEVEVEDLDQALDFFVERLGFDVRRRGAPLGRSAEVAPAHSRVSMTLLEANGGGNTSSPASGVIFVTPDMREALWNLELHGVYYEPTADGRSVRFFDDENSHYLLMEG